MHTFESESSSWLDLTNISFSVILFLSSPSCIYIEAKSFFVSSTDVRSSSFCDNFFCRSSTCSDSATNSSLSFSNCNDLEANNEKQSACPSWLSTAFLFSSLSPWSLCFFVGIDWAAFLLAVCNKHQNPLWRAGLENAISSAHKILKQITSSQQNVHWII